MNVFFQTINYITDPTGVGCQCPKLLDFFVHIPFCGSSLIPYQKLANKQKETGANVCGTDQIEINNLTNPTTKTDITVLNLESEEISKTSKEVDRGTVVSL